MSETYLQANSCVITEFNSDYKSFANIWIIGLKRSDVSILDQKFSSIGTGAKIQNITK